MTNTNQSNNTRDAKSDDQKDSKRVEAGKKAAETRGDHVDASNKNQSSSQGKRNNDR